MERAYVGAGSNLGDRESTIRGVAWKHGLYASLAPKPWPEAAGNGGHLHLSLWDGEQRNLFFDAGAPDRFSEHGRRFLAGVLTHLPALVALTCPGVNSYRRLQPRFWSSASTRTSGQRSAR